MAFETVSDATKIWIKGRDFTVPRLLGPSYKADWDKYQGGSLCIFRLAPQDYHRFHSPVDGKIGEMTYIAGEYYTVNVRLSSIYCMAVRGLTFGVPVAPGHSDDIGRVWGECEKDCSH